MAKNTTNATQNAYEEMLALLSPEERANLEQMTGQANGGGGSKTPVIKVNYNRADTAGKKVARGNYVLNQKCSFVEGKQVATEIGTDLGAEFEAVILKYGMQFSYYSGDAKKRCASQILTERGEVPIGNNLKCICNDKSCPRRKEGLDKAEKCSAQYVVFLKLPEGVKTPDGKDAPVAMMYVKGSDYMPFQSYVQDELKGVPSIAVKTKFSTSEEGSAVVYFVKHFAKGEPVTKEEFKVNFELVAGVNKNLLEHKEENQKKIASATSAASSADSGSNMTVINGDDAEILW